MQYHIITLPFDGARGQFVGKELEAFCQRHRVVQCQAHFFIHHDQSFWTCFLLYEPLKAPNPLQPASSQPTITLDEAQQHLFEALKAWRKERAHKDGITHFLIAKNSELQQIAIERPQTASALLAITGFGKKKVAKYGEEILTLCNTPTP